MPPLRSPPRQTWPLSTSGRPDTSLASLTDPPEAAWSPAGVEISGPPLNENFAEDQAVVHEAGELPSSLRLDE
jgi:hypothetical protein